jgi:hypothetical protein
LPPGIRNTTIDNVEELKNYLLENLAPASSLTSSDLPQASDQTLPSSASAILGQDDSTPNTTSTDPLFSEVTETTETNIASAYLTHGTEENRQQVIQHRQRIASGQASSSDPITNFKVPGFQDDSTRFGVNSINTDVDNPSDEPLSVTVSDNTDSTSQSPSQQSSNPNSESASSVVVNSESENVSRLENTFNEEYDTQNIPTEEIVSSSGVTTTPDPVFEETLAEADQMSDFNRRLEDLQNEASELIENNNQILRRNDQRNQNRDRGTSFNSGPTSSDPSVFQSGNRSIASSNTGNTLAPTRQKYSKQEFNDFINSSEQSASPTNTGSRGSAQKSGTGKISSGKGGYRMGAPSMAMSDEDVVDLVALGKYTSKKEKKVASSLRASKYNDPYSHTITKIIPHSEIINAGLPKIIELYALEGKVFYSAYPEKGKLYIIKFDIKKELFDKGDIKERQYLMNAISSMRGKLGTEKHMIKVRNSVVESGPRKVYNVKMHRTKLVKLYDHSILGDEDLDDMSEFKVELFIRNLVSLN